jgi:hypothetical protein
LLFPPRHVKRLQVSLDHLRDVDGIVETIMLSIIELQFYVDRHISRSAGDMFTDSGSAVHVRIVFQYNVDVSGDFQLSNPSSESILSPVTQYYRCVMHDSGKKKIRFSTCAKSSFHAVKVNHDLFVDGPQAGQ